MEKVGAAEGVRAFSMLDLHNPSLDWVQLAQGMGVEAVRVDTCHGLDAAFRSAIAASGPRLIEALV